MRAVFAMGQSQPPEAPPPPKLPPPPENPPPPPPPDQPPPPMGIQAPGPPRPPNIENTMTKNAMTAAIAAITMEPATNHAAAPMTPAPTKEPPTLPNIRRNTDPTMGTRTSRKMNRVPKSKWPPLVDLDDFAGFASASG